MFNGMICEERSWTTIKHWAHTLQFIFAVSLFQVTLNFQFFVNYPPKCLQQWSQSVRITINIYDDDNSNVKLNRFSCTAMEKYVINWWSHSDAVPIVNWFTEMCYFATQFQLFVCLFAVYVSVGCCPRWVWMSVLFLMVQMIFGFDAKVKLYSLTWNFINKVVLGQQNGWRRPSTGAVAICLASLPHPNTTATITTRLNNTMSTTAAETFPVHLYEPPPPLPSHSLQK